MHDIYILGSGAMGSLWASYFYPQHTLHFIQRQANPKGYTFNLEPNQCLIHANSHDALRLNNTIQFLVLATKAYDALTAIDSIADQLSTDAQVVLLQNGLGSQQAIADKYPNIQLYACSSTEGAYKKDEHTLVHAGKGINSIGPLNQQASLNKLQTWLAPNRFQWHDDIQPILWRKFMINCAINPLTVLYDCQNGELIKHPQYREHMSRICDEIDLLTNALNYQIEPAFELAEKVCQLTANNFSSMLQDKHKGNATELSFMTGYLLSQAARLEVSCPVNQALLNVLNQHSLGSY